MAKRRAAKPAEKLPPAPLAGADLEETPTELVDIAGLREHPKNYKLHKENQLVHIQETMRIAGVYKNVVIARDGTILMGHGVVKAALAAGRKRISARRLDVDPNDPRALKLVAVDNEVGNLAERDDAALAGLLRGVVDVEGLLGTGLDEDQWARLLARTTTGSGGNSDEDSVVEPPKKATTKAGQLWILGNHRLLCGDSTNSEHVGKLLAGGSARLMATDPPYGVDYHAVKAGIPGPGYAKKRFKDWGDIENDNVGSDGLAKLLNGVFELVPIVEHGAVYVWHAAGELTEVFRSAIKAVGWMIHRQIIWKKPGFVMTRSGMYHWAHESCFFGWKQGSQPPWYGPKNQTSVWEAGRDGVAVHPTQKPVRLFEIPMENHVAPGEICYEPFSGSGSQIIAGEKLGRSVCAMEIDPRYVDATIERWQTFSGKKAVLER